EDKAVAILRERGEKLEGKRGARETAFGRFGLYCGLDKSTGAMVELKCESAPVTQNEQFINLCNDLAEGLAKSQGDIQTVEALLALPSPSKPSMTLGEQKAELFNRIRENFEVGRMCRMDGTCGGYSHNLGTVAGVLVQVEGGSDEAAKDVSMHIAAMRPVALSKDDLDTVLVDQEREYLRSAAIKEGKPANIVDKMVEGRLQQFIAEKALLAQPYVKDDKQTVGDFAKSKGMTVKKFELFILGQ
ncbi:MAG: translation elongation factor Ts, partial [Planctomycetales bacterium]|nr:translation elongation factor Ts [Planctomycetales bacterium]